VGFGQGCQLLTNVRQLDLAQSFDTGSEHVPVGINSQQLVGSKHPVSQLLADLPHKRLLAAGQIPIDLPPRPLQIASFIAADGVPAG
jgi:hypothetical protein